MNTNDAMNLLNLSGEVTQKEIKKSFKAASFKYHPDRNPLAGREMMQAINTAYETLKNLGDKVLMDDDFKAYDFAEELNNILNKLFELDGINIEVCGNWVWITGESFPHAKRLGKKEGGIGCTFTKKEGVPMWFYRPVEYKSKNRKKNSLDDIRSAYGSVKVNKSRVNKRLAA